ncbi:hypothetical protein MUU72_22575 [Streptomyces sp. RS10V-4]|uniref:hypothetical protein n=1 Tax=Streptomyces rhizoryzae TaxID=2932493 RepID=UPI002004F31A|nr:hypothetical protein [Streptomyces rhizoryzae]MCK7625853.1 hypothetical protein [Streptomyces rhizoryzae]
MSYRAALVALFLAPVAWGAAGLAGALGAAPEVVCPGENVRADGEEHPGPMRPGDTGCSVLEGSLPVATRTYEEQRNHQALQRRRDAGEGVLLMAYGAAGALLAWRATRPGGLGADRPGGP